MATVEEVKTTEGIDVSTLVSSSDFQCLKKKGYDFVIVRAYRSIDVCQSIDVCRSIGKPDSNAVQTIENAIQAGFRHVDVYMFPSPKCGKPASVQVHEMGQSL